MTRRLLDCGIVLSMDPEIGELRDAEVLLDGDTIEEVGTDLNASDAEVLDLTDHIVMPGLVNTHVHLFQTGVRGVAADWTLDDYFERMLGELRPHFEPEDLYLADLFGAYEQLNAGVTSVYDWCHTVNSPEHADRAVDALADSGIRAIYGYGTPGIDQSEWYHESTRRHPEDVERMASERIPAGDGRVELGMSIRGPDISPYETTKRDLELAQDLGVMASMHIGVNAYGSSSDEHIARMAEDGLLGPDVNFVHANHLSTDTFELIAEEGVSVSVTPEVEMQMGHGLPITGNVLEVGGRMVLGSDVVSAIGSDMFTPMRFSLQTARALEHDAAIERGESVDHLSPTVRDVLRAGTIEGARALGLGEKTGSLTPGKQADVIAIRTDDVAVGPVHDPAGTVVLHAGPADVSDVFVDGERVKRAGELVAEDADQRWSDLIESGRRLLQAADVDTQGP